MPFSLHCIKNTYSYPDLITVAVKFGRWLGWYFLSFSSVKLLFSALPILYFPEGSDDPQLTIMELHSFWVVYLRKLFWNPAGEICLFSLMYLFIQSFIYFSKGIWIFTLQFGL